MSSILPPGFIEFRVFGTFRRPVILRKIARMGSSGTFCVKPPDTRAFTLIEMLVSMAVLMLIMLLLFQTISSSSTLWTRTTGKVQAFQAARAAFESMTRNLTQASLQNYYGYADSSGNPVPLINPSFKLSGGGNVKRNKIPTKYLRASELHFVSGPAAELLGQAGQSGLVTSGDAVFFQAPIGFSDGSYQTRPGLLNICGYYVQFERDDDNAGKGTGAIPAFASSLPGGAPKVTHRYRLMEVVQPADQNGIYLSTNQEVDADGLPVFNYDLQWLKNLDLSRRVNRHVLGDNILLLVILPKLAPEDEKSVYNQLQAMGPTPSWFTPSLPGNLIAPTYAFDSRSWETGYAGPAIKGDTTANRNLLEKVVMNRLPPIVEVVMVAIDDRSAQQLANLYGGADGSSPPLNNAALLAKLNLSGAFTDASKLHDQNGSKGDLSRLQDGLDSLSLNYRIFHTELRLPGAAYGQ